MEGLGSAQASEGRVFNRPFVLLWAYSTLTSIAWAALLLAVPLYVKGPLGGGDIAVGLVMTATTLVSAGMLPILGRFGDLRGRRLLIVLGPLWFATFVGMFGLATSAQALLVLRAVAGLGDAAFMVGALTLVNDLAPAGRRGEAYSIFSLSTWAGMGLGPVCADFVLHAGSFNAVWLMCVTLSIVAAALGATLPRPTRAHETGKGSGFGVTVPALLPGVILAFEIVGFVAFFVFGPLYARELGMASGGIVILVASAVLVLIRVFGRTLPDRLGSYGGSAAGLAFVAGGLALIAILGNPLSLFVGGACLGVGHALAYPALLLLAVSRSPDADRSAALGTFKACESLGYAGGAAALGVIAATVGYGLAFGVGAASALAGVLVLRMRLRRPTR